MVSFDAFERKVMGISGTGAVVGALVGGIARGSVVLLNIESASEGLWRMALPSAGIGLVVGAIAGAVGRPLPGAVVGAVLSGVVFELFMCAFASIIGVFSPKTGDEFFLATLRIGLEMAAAGAVAGGVGGWVGKLSGGKAPLAEGDERRTREGAENGQGPHRPTDIAGLPKFPG
jgi:hypothetical protein